MGRLTSDGDLLRTFGTQYGRTEEGPPKTRAFGSPSLFSWSLPERLCLDASYPSRSGRCVSE